MTRWWVQRKPTRPHLAQITRADGTVEPLAVAKTADPLEFELTTLDGGPVEMREGDSIWVDLIGPGQSVSVKVAEQ